MKRLDVYCQIPQNQRDVIREKERILVDEMLEPNPDEQIINSVWDDIYGILSGCFSQKELDEAAKTLVGFKRETNTQSGIFLDGVVESEYVRIERVLKETEFIRLMYEDISCTTHAMRDRMGIPTQTLKDWIAPYEPTFFIYNFFCFNMVYNIDWALSVQKGAVKDSEAKDHIKPNRLIDFCFSNQAFVDEFYPIFKEILTIKYNEDQIKKLIKGIVPDKRIEASIPSSFIVSCKRVLEEQKTFDIMNMKNIYCFIYRVRCNIVHGVKSMQHLKESGQRARIEIYSFFIIALIHMLFMSLKYRLDGYYTRNDSASFLTRLKRYHNPAQQTI